MFGLALSIGKYIRQRRVTVGKRSRSHKYGRTTYSCSYCDQRVSRVGFSEDARCPKCSRQMEWGLQLSAGYCLFITWARWVKIHFGWLIKGTQKPEPL